MFALTALAIALTAGFGLGLWLLLARVLGLTLFGWNWLALVQVHGLFQLFGFAGLFAMGIGLNAIPRFRGGPATSPRVGWAVYVLTMVGLVFRAIAQPMLELPGRDAILAIGGASLITATSLFAASALRSLSGGRNPHRADELLMAAGIAILPVGAILVALEMLGTTPVIVDQATDDRALWVILLGSLATMILGVWARLAPGFIASVPFRRRPLIAGGVIWLLGVALFAVGVGAGALAMLTGFAVVTVAVGLFSPSIARQRLGGHARLTRIGVTLAFAWAFIGLAILSAGLLGVFDSYLQISAARHALGLGFVTLMIYSVAPRALPAFLGRRLRSDRLQMITLGLTNVAVVARVLPQLLGAGDATSAALVGLSGLIAYTALVLFAINVMRTVRGASGSAPAPGAAVPIEMRLGRR